MPKTGGSFLIGRYVRGGRKTVNVIRETSTMCRYCSAVDKFIKRISRKLPHKETEPEKDSKRDLMKVLPEDHLDPLEYPYHHTNNHLYSQKTDCGGIVLNNGVPCPEVPASRKRNRKID